MLPMLKLMHKGDFDLIRKVKSRISGDKTGITSE